MKNRAVFNFLVLFLCCILLGGCGEEEVGYSITSGTQSESQSSELQETVTPQQDEEAYWMEAMGIEILTKEEEEERKSTRENEITLGIVGSGMNEQKSVSNFNGAQDECWVEIQKYESREALLLDVVRGQGPDIFSVERMDLYSLAEKGVVEDLTPYFESSDVVKKEDIVGSIWRAGSIGTGMYYVIPRFYPKIMLVEKGYTDNGVWSVEDYLALAEKYPEGKLSDSLMAKNPYSLFLVDLGMAVESYIDWEDESCSFDSQEFITLLEKLNYHAQKAYVGEYKTLAEQMYHKELLTNVVSLKWMYHMTEYRDLRDSMLEFCEIAGIPNGDGQLRYSMTYNENYGINSASDKKEMAWSFLEYLISEEYQGQLMDFWNGGDGMFPVRRDVLENTLLAEVDWETEQPYVYKNTYTGERVFFESDFTEEDVQVILDIVENCYYEYAIGGELSQILADEIVYYFKGDKSAKEVAEIIQNRVSLYLIE